MSSKSKRSRPVVRPLAAFEQQHAVAGEDENPPRGWVCANSRRVTMVSHVSFSKASGGGASPWNCKPCGLSDSGIFAFGRWRRRRRGRAAAGRRRPRHRRRGSALRRRPPARGWRACRRSPARRAAVETTRAAAGCAGRRAAPARSPAEERRCSGARARSSAHGVRTLAASACSRQRSRVAWMSPAKISAK